MFNILIYHVPVNRFSQFFIYFQKTGEILPPSGRGKPLPIHSRFNFIKMLRPRFQVCRHGRMDIGHDRIFLPDCIIGFHINFFNSVQRCNIKFPDGFVIFRRISGRHNNPAAGNPVAAKSLVL